MDNKQIVRSLRKEFNKPVFALLIFYGIMNIAVIIAAVAQTAILIFQFAEEGNIFAWEQLVDQIVASVYSNGWGYVLAYLIGAFLLIMWKKPQFTFREMWKSSASMKISTLLILLCLTIAAQALYESFAQWFFSFLEMLGLEYNGAAVGDAIDFNSFSMVLYTCVLAPVGEEILFRGMLLRSLDKWGKKFAILATAVLFGLFHGNLEQSVFAFAIGLLLGYVAAEYSLVWSIVLHGFNNLVLCYLLPLILAPVSPYIAELVMNILIWGCALGAALIMFAKRMQVGEYMLTKRIHPLCLKAFFTSPAMIVFMVLMIGNILLTILLQLI